MATPPGTIFSRTDPDQWAVTHSLEGVRDACFWLENTYPAGLAYPPLAKATEADLLVVGGGYCGLWTAVVAKQRDPHLRVVLLEAQQVGPGSIRAQWRLLRRQHHSWRRKRPLPLAR